MPRTRQRKSSCANTGEGISCGLPTCCLGRPMIPHQRACRRHLAITVPYQPRAPADRYSSGELRTRGSARNAMRPPPSRMLAPSPPRRLTTFCDSAKYGFCPIVQDSGLFPSRVDIAVSAAPQNRETFGIYDAVKEKPSISTLCCHCWGGGRLLNYCSAQLEWPSRHLSWLWQ